MAILQDTAALMAEIEALKQANAKLRAQGQSKLMLKVSTKGALSVYGMGRWPVTLYREQWARLLDKDMVQLIQDFIEAHDGELSFKGEAE